jgi:hypothetical protein
MAPLGCVRCVATRGFPAEFRRDGVGPAATTVGGDGPSGGTRNGPDAHPPSSLLGVHATPAGVGSGNVDAERLPVVIELSGEGVVANSPVPLVRFEQDEFSFVYGGSWLTATSVSRSGGDARFAASPGASFTATFTGDAFRWITTTGSNRGIAQVTIDGVDHGTVDTYTPRVGWQQPVFEAAGLGGGEHTVVITVTGDANPASTNRVIEIDAIEAAGLPSQGNAAG